ncbi:MAG: hypothetical protein QXF69_05720 [Thermofilaceae archaeon]
MIVIHTPGHSLYTDTLIMYALASAARERLRRVVGHGISYSLAIENLSEVDLAQRILSRFDIIRSDFSGRLAKLVDEKDVGASYDSLSRIDGLARYLKSLREPGHAQQEGRLGRGKSLKLPLMPSAGKYFRIDLTMKEKYDVSEYEVCSYCFALALLGLAVGTVSFASRTTQVVSTVGFEGEVDGSSLNSLLGVFEQLREFQDEMMKSVRVDEISDRVLGSLLLTRFDDDIIRSLYGTNASWKSLVVRFEVARAVQVRGFTTVEVDSILTALEELIELREKAIAEQVQRPQACRGRLNEFVAKMISIGAYGALEKLLDFLVTRDLPILYTVVREAFTSAEGRWLAGSELILCLASLSAEHA